LDILYGGEAIEKSEKQEREKGEPERIDSPDLTLSKPSLRVECSSDDKK